MYILKNAITSITRNKGRNILIGIIIMIISKTFSEPLLFLFIVISSYHNELSLTFLETKLPRHKIIIFTTELNKPIAVA